MDSAEAYPPALVERMRALISRQAERWSVMADGRTFSQEAQEIVDEIKRLDPDRRDAERIAAGYCGGANVDAVLNGIKHGRELAGQERGRAA
jgi:hypothetical protein